MPSINPAGLHLVESFEGLNLHAYRDMVGVLTIGYGHTGKDVHLGQVITQAQADALLKADLQSACNSVQHAVQVQLTPNQFSALASLVFNVGPGCLEGTHLIQNLNAGNFKAAADNILAFDHAGGQQVAGLTRRRQAERALFLTV